MVSGAATQRGALTSMDILNLPYFRAGGVAETKDSFSIKAVVALPNEIAQVSGCPFCSSTAEERVRFGSKAQSFVDAPIRGKHVTVTIDRQRYRCKGCSRTYSQYLPHLNDKRSMTERCIEYICGQAIRRPFSQVAEEVGVSEGTVRGIFGDYIVKMDSERSVETPEWLGIDELKLANHLRCVLSNVKDRKAVDLLPTRDHRTVGSYLSRMADRDRVQVVTMDMWKPYKDLAANIFPNAQVIVDKFHIVRMGNFAVDQVRKDCRTGLTGKDRRKLMHGRFQLFRRANELTDRERLTMELWSAFLPDLRAAYECKESFYRIWDDSRDSVDAYTLYAEWEANIPDQIEYAFRPIKTAVSNWHKEIFAYFTIPATNAYTECLNGIIRVSNRLGRGYSFDVIRAKVLYAGERGDDVSFFEAAVGDQVTNPQELHKSYVWTQEVTRFMESTSKAQNRKQGRQPKNSNHQL